VRVRGSCGNCVRGIAVPDPEAAGAGACELCGRAWSYAPVSGGGGNAVTRCGFCGGRAFFVQRDFDQRLGCLIMAGSIAAAVFVGWRFGWIYFTPVLLATVLVDWIVALRVRPVTICYRCDAEYRDVSPNSRHRAYDPHIAERFAKVKTLGRMAEPPLR
jgi:hypothetical protein